ncbi:hypothetical protein [Shouchella patagoniensis]|uniref:hypothetical protein n=1 Tax=Shouchella patagoniensis TaxID=228576 RepID=UPI000994F0F2|nr:hypothetical protein [Shouchella patagoniensis]
MEKETMNYAVRDNKIVRVKPVKLSKRGTSVWCHLESGGKAKLVSMKNLFNTELEAKKELKIRKNKEERKQKAIGRERKKKEERRKKKFGNGSIKNMVLKFTH